MKPIFKVLYRVFCLYTWVRRSLPRRFTPFGLGVLGALVLCVLMVPDTDNNLAYQALAFLLALLLFPLSTCLFFRGRFAADRLLPRFGTVGCPITYRVMVKNLTRKTQPGLAVIENLADLPPGFPDWLEVQLADEKRARSFRFTRGRRANPFVMAKVNNANLSAAEPGEEGEASIQLTPLRRGLLRFRGLAVARPDPLGIVRSLVNVHLPQSVLILPRRYLLPPIALPGSEKYQQGGVALASSVGQSEEFVSLREYREGDPLRHIHWRSWARVGTPVVKEFEDEFFVRHALVLDTFTDDGRSEAFEEAVSVAASFASTVRTEESLLDLLFVGPESFCFTAGRSLGRTDQMLQILASVRACRDQPFVHLERLVLNHARLVSGCICVLLAWDEPRREFIKKLQALDVPLLVLVIVEVGKGRKLDPGPMAADPEHFRVLEVGQVEQGLAKLV